jgi:hypothetical protein
LSLKTQQAPCVKAFLTRELFYPQNGTYINSAKPMQAQDLPQSIFHMFEKNVGKKVRVITDSAYGFEGILEAITQEPAGIWLSEVYTIVLRSTLAQPVPQVVSRDEAGDLYLSLNSVQRIEVLQQTQSRHR